MHPSLQITIEIFVRVQFRGIGREKKEFDVLRIILQPCLDYSGMMDTQIVQNEKDLSLRILEQLLDEFRQHLRIHAVLVHHESHLPLIGDGRDHVNRGPLGR